MIALLVAAVLVPASAEGALVVEDVSGIRALLTTAGRRAPALAPTQFGVTLRDRVGVDLLAEQAEWGLARRGPRVLVFIRGASGLMAPVASAKKARTALALWLNASPRRAGALRNGQLLTASGREAKALLKSMQRPKMDLRSSGPAWAFIRLREPLRTAALAIDASAGGLVLRGTVTASDALFAGPPPAGCDGNPAACLRASLGPAGRGALELALQQLGIVQPGLRSAERVVERIDSLAPQELSDARSLPDALRIIAVFNGAQSDGPPFSAQLDPAQFDAALARLTPLDALSGVLAAGAFAAHLLYGDLLRNCGPLQASGNASANGAEIEIRLPVR